mmetsp:Transcript_56192/g.156500  ORF Transcript_56192/g.156500 Transcript_56192/m.156500 type:complete len:157 (-) Transcript_56192:103-573(-)
MPRSGATWGSDPQHFSTAFLGLPAARVATVSQFLGAPVPHAVVYSGRRGEWSDSGAQLLPLHGASAGWPGSCSTGACPGRSRASSAFVDFLSPCNKLKENIEIVAKTTKDWESFEEALRQRGVRRALGGRELFTDLLNDARKAAILLQKLGSTEEA